MSEPTTPAEEAVFADGAAEEASVVDASAETAENDASAESAETPAAQGDAGALEMPVEAHVADPVLLASRGLAREALAEITDQGSIGSDAGHEVHDAHVLTLLFECRLPGYPGWHWAATLARVDESAPVTVLEVELLAGPGSVVAPEWVPWSVRLAQFRESQARQAAEEASAAEAAAIELGEDASDDDSLDGDILDGDILDNDFSDFDDEIDGVDLEGADDDDDDDDDDAHADDDEADDFEGFSAER